MNGISNSKADSYSAFFMLILKSLIYWGEQYYNIFLKENLCPILTHNFPTLYIIWDTISDEFFYYMVYYFKILIEMFAYKTCFAFLNFHLFSTNSMRFLKIWTEKKLKKIWKLFFNSVKQKLMAKNCWNFNAIED